MCDKYSPLLHEKRTYRIENFKVSDNTSGYRATTELFKIQFGPKTYVAEEAAEIPMEVFTFKPIAEIIALPDEENVEYLVGEWPLLKILHLFFRLCQFYFILH